MIRPSVLCLASLCLGGASAAPTLRAWSDAAALHRGDDQRRVLNFQRVLACVPPGPTAARDGLRRLDAEIARLSKGSAERTTYEGVRPTLAEAAEKERRNPPAAAPGVPKDLADAVKRAETWIEKNAPEGMKAFRASAESKSAPAASQAALEASLSGHRGAALAALLTAHRLAPKNAETLVNLGGALALFGLDGEALTVLAAAEKLPSGEGALGWSTQATLLNNRGFALLHLGRFAEAETALRGASKLVPNLAEAQLNLSRALTCQGKPDEALVAARRGARRTASESAKPGTPVPPEAVVELPQPEPGEEMPDETHRPADFVFDVSRGQTFNLPNLKLPQTPADAVKLLPSYQKLLEELRARDQTMSERQNVLQIQIRARKEPVRLVQERRDALLRAIYNADDEPKLANLWRAQTQAQENVSDIWTNFWHCEGGCSIDTFIQQASASTDYTKTMRDLCVPALVAANNSWRGAMHAHATELARAAEATYRLETGLAANYSDPAWHELASLQAEKGAVNAFATLVHDAVIWSQDVQQYQDKCADPPNVPPAAPEQVAGNLRLDRTASCKDLFGTAALKASFRVVEISVGCETVALKLATPGWIGAFTKLEKNFAHGNVTVSAGAEAGVTVPFTSSGVKAGAGFYVTVDGQGEFRDVGTLAEANATLGLKVDDGKSGLGVKGLNGKWSLLPSVDAP